MIKIFETGDLHIGKKFNRFPEVKDELIESRFECLARMIKAAEEKECAIFAITGDTFDNVSTIKVADVRRVVEILSSFSGTVLILPGNHDYYNEETKVWKDFQNALDKVDHNILLLKDFSPVTIEVGDELVCIYPAYCQSKHSAENNLAWISNAEINKSIYNVGIAHGAIQGITPDMSGEYFPMTEMELNAIPVDVWLIGHTHIPYPVLELDKAYRGYKIFNAGTPEQLDLHNNTKGFGYVIMLDKSKEVTSVVAEAYHSGMIEYKDYEIKLKPEDGGLEKILRSIVAGEGDRTIARFTLTGAVSQEDFNTRNQLYQSAFSGLMTYEVEDSNLGEQISEERIRAEFPEIGLAASILEQLINDPTELQMAYALLKECRK